MNKFSPPVCGTSWLCSATLATTALILPVAPALAEPLIDRLGLEAMSEAIDRGDCRRIEAVIVERGGEIAQQWEAARLALAGSAY